jgi:hypothetical protein
MIIEIFFIEVLFYLESSNSYQVESRYYCENDIFLVTTSRFYPNKIPLKYLIGRKKELMTKNNSISK